MNSGNVEVKIFGRNRGVKMSKGFLYIFLYSVGVAFLFTFLVVTLSSSVVSELDSLTGKWCAAEAEESTFCRMMANEKVGK